MIFNQVLIKLLEDLRFAVAQSLVVEDLWVISALLVTDHGALNISGKESTTGRYPWSLFYVLIFLFCFWSIILNAKTYLVVTVSATYICYLLLYGNVLDLLSSAESKTLRKRPTDEQLTLLNAL